MASRRCGSNFFLFSSRPISRRVPLRPAVFTYLTGQLDIIAAAACTPTLILRLLMPYPNARQAAIMAAGRFLTAFVRVLQSYVRYMILLTERTLLQFHGQMHTTSNKACTGTYAAELGTSACTGQPLSRAETTRVLSIKCMRTRHPIVVAPLPCLPPPHVLCTLLLHWPAAPSLRDAPIEGTMNGFTEQGLDEDSFGASKGGIASFDAFRK
jgi:hypothetical protein